MKTLLSFAALSLVTVSAVVGCAGSTVDAPTGSDDITSRSSDALLDGDYKLTGTENATGFGTISLKGNHTYTAEQSCPPPPPGAVATCRSIRLYAGSWKVTTSGPQLGRPQGAPLLVLTDELGTATSYFYSLKANQLSLSTSIVDPQTSLFAKDLSSLPKLEANDVCADANQNSLGICPASTGCEAQNDVSRCVATP